MERLTLTLDSATTEGDFSAKVYIELHHRGSRGEPVEGGVLAPEFDVYEVHLTLYELGDDGEGSGWKTLELPEELAAFEAEYFEGICDAIDEELNRQEGLMTTTRRREYKHGDPIVGTECRKLEWGIPAPVSAPAAWGARAIGSGQGFDLLYDRQCAWGGKEDRTRIGRLLDGHVLRAAKKEWRDLRDIGEVASDVHKEVVLYEDDEIVLKGNSNASGSPKYGDPGYVYLVAYLKTDTDTETGENR